MLTVGPKRCAPFTDRPRSPVPQRWRPQLIPHALVALQVMRPSSDGVFNEQTPVRLQAYRRPSPRQGTDLSGGPQLALGGLASISVATPSLPPPPPPVFLLASRLAFLRVSNLGSRPAFHLLSPLAFHLALPPVWPQASQLVSPPPASLPVCPPASLPASVLGCLATGLRGVSWASVLESPSRTLGHSYSTACFPASHRALATLLPRRRLRPSAALWT